MLKKQIARAEALGLSPIMATELEFFLVRAVVPSNRRRPGSVNLETDQRL